MLLSPQEQRMAATFAQQRAGMIVSADVRALPPATLHALMERSGIRPDPVLGRALLARLELHARAGLRRLAQRR